MPELAPILPPTEFTQIPEYKRYLDIMASGPPWVHHPKVVGLVKRCDFTADSAPEEWKELKQQVVWMFAHAIHVLGLALDESVPPYYNDDDRWDPSNWDYENNHGISWLTGAKNEQVQMDHPDTVVIHHTHTPEDVPYEYLNALALLRLYYPQFLNRRLPVASGHEFEGAPTFMGYHYLVRQDGTVINPLPIRATGFHAGSYPMNIRATAIAFIGDHTNEPPSDLALASANGIINTLKPAHILGHQDVVNKVGEQVAVNCPSEHGWHQWKEQLINQPET